jgi:hypothetical protein
MKLKQLQQERIEQIIREEMRNLKEGWIAADQLKASSSYNERNLFEVGSPIEQDLSADSLSSALQQTSVDAADACLVKFDNELFKQIAAVLKSHGLLAAGEDADSVYEMFADFDEDSMVLAQNECVTDIVTALENMLPRWPSWPQACIQVVNNEKTS